MSATPDPPTDPVVYMNTDGTVFVGDPCSPDGKTTVVAVVECHDTTPSVEVFCTTNPPEGFPVFCADYVGEPVVAVGPPPTLPETGAEHVGLGALAALLLGLGLVLRRVAA